VSSVIYLSLMFDSDTGGLTFQCIGEPVAQMVTSFDVSSSNPVPAAVKEVVSSVLEGSTNDKRVLCTSFVVIRCNAHVKA
jgi:hypothetical protein